MQREVQVYSTKGFFPAPDTNEICYAALMKAREVACKDFIKSAQDSLLDILKIMGLEEFAGKKYTVEVGTVPNCELLAVWDSPIPHIRVEYVIDTPEYRERKNPISDLRKERKSKRTEAFKTFINYNGVDIPLIVTTKREGVRVGYRKDERESITPNSIHELIHAARSDLDSIGNGPLLAELFAQQFDVEEQMEGLYKGLKDRRPKPYIEYCPQFDAHNCARDIIVTFPVGDLKLEDLGERPTHKVRNKFQNTICEGHQDYKEAKAFLEGLAEGSFEGFFFYIPEIRQILFIKPNTDALIKKVLANDAKETLRVEESLTHIAEAVSYTPIKFLRIISRLTYQEVNSISDRLYKGVSLDDAIAETVQPWRISMFEGLLARDDEIELVKSPLFVGGDELLLFHTMTDRPFSVKNFNEFLVGVGLR